MDRFFDTASLYETERSLGSALKESGIAREDVIIETKLRIDEMGADNRSERSLRFTKTKQKVTHILLPNY